ncbi:MAG: hypothetical protein K2X87_05425 [Gemmataceae bacterium]|nr:hypothetical protein [Gemmataceae bacterium]
MPIVVEDAALAATLSAVAEATTLRGPDGRFLGLFTPAAEFDPSPQELEEMDRAINDPNTKWYTAEEVMERLREIDQSGPHFCGPAD